MNEAWKQGEMSCPVLGESHRNDSYNEKVLALLSPEIEDGNFKRKIFGFIHV